MIQRLCEYCEQPIERGEHAADGFELDGRLVTFRIRIEAQPGTPRPDLHKRCVQEAIAETRDVVSIKSAAH